MVLHRRITVAAYIERLTLPKPEPLSRGFPISGNKLKCGANDYKIHNFIVTVSFHIIPLHRFRIFPIIRIITVRVTARVRVRKWKLYKVGFYEMDQHPDN